MPISQNRIITVLLDKRKLARSSRPAALKAIAILISLAAFGSAAGMAVARSASSGTNVHVATNARRAHTRRTLHRCPGHRHSAAISHGPQKSRHHRRSHCLRKVLKPKTASTPKPTPAPTPKPTPGSTPKPAPAPTPTPTPTPTPATTPTPTPTPATTPTPTPTPTEQNPGLPPTPPGNNGCDLFATPSGLDSNAGSRSAPFRSLHKLATSLKAGETGCLQSGETFDSGGNLYLSPGETHGKEGQPVTITSTNPGEPATITHGLALEHGVNYVTFTHVDFNWSMPKPWVCWNAEGDLIPGQVISGPGTCSAGTPSSEDAVQIGMSGKDDSLTYDEITSDDTNICINLYGSGTLWGEGNVLEHDRIHNCGPTVEASKTGFPTPNEEWGWHSHGVYDYARGTIIKNDYIYDNSRDGVLLYGGGEGAVVEHNVIDHNGAGIWFGNDNNDRATRNIITNSTSPRGVADYGIGSYEPGSGNVATNNCLYGNLSGEIEDGGVASTDNKTDTNPLYINAERNEYTLQADSPCLGYGPDTAQP